MAHARGLRLYHTTWLLYGPISDPQNPQLLFKVSGSLRRRCFLSNSKRNDKAQPLTRQKPRVKQTAKSLHKRTGVRKGPGRDPAVDCIGVVISGWSTHQMFARTFPAGSSRPGISLGPRRLLDARPLPRCLDCRHRPCPTKKSLGC